jgi:hypothetical protein
LVVSLHQRQSSWQAKLRAHSYCSASRVEGSIFRILVELFGDANGLSELLFTFRAL